jgi:hypothetical protein
MGREQQLVYGGAARAHPTPWVQEESHGPFKGFAGNLASPIATPPNSVVLVYIHTSHNDSINHATTAGSPTCPGLTFARRWNFALNNPDLSGGQAGEMWWANAPAAIDNKTLSINMNHAGDMTVNVLYATGCKNPAAPFHSSVVGMPAYEPWNLLDANHEHQTGGVTIDAPLATLIAWGMGARPGFIAGDGWEPLPGTFIERHGAGSVYSVQSIMTQPRFVLSANESIVLSSKAALSCLMVDAIY